MLVYSSDNSSSLKNYQGISEEISNWLHDFLASENPHLGRKGAVCPYVKKSLALDSTFISICPTTPNPKKDNIIINLMENSAIFRLLDSIRDKSVFNCMLIVFPDLSDQEVHLIDQIQRKKKEYFLEKGLMLGEFHNANNSKGLHNKEFKPFQSPYPMLAIRKMVHQDLPFMDLDTDTPKKRHRYLSIYRDNFNSKLKPVDRQKLAARIDYLEKIL